MVFRNKRLYEEDNPGPGMPQFASVVSSPVSHEVREGEAKRECRIFPHRVWCQTSAKIAIAAGACKIRRGEFHRKV